MKVRPHAFGSVFFVFLTPLAGATEPTEAPTSVPTVAAPAESAAAPVPTAAIASTIDPEAKRICDRFYPSRLQSGVRAACALGAQTLARSARRPAQIKCRLEYGASPSATMACFVGTSVAEAVAAKSGQPEAHRRTCAAQYPAHTEIDSFLQESCLAGLYLPQMLGRSDTNACRELSPERSFRGPCETGLSLALKPFPDEKDASSTGEPSPNAHSRLCDQYFDHRQLHQGYRACLSARGLALRDVAHLSDAISACEQVISDAKNDLEKAACMVGLGFAKSGLTGAPANPRFEKCGRGKVSYSERNTLACLAAATLLDFGDRGVAEKGCRLVFTSAKTSSREDCARATAQF